MYPRPNRIVTALNRGEIALGSLTLFQEPAIGEILGANGFDFLIIDMEHAAASEQESRAIRPGRGCGSLRVGGADALERGVADVHDERRFPAFAGGQTPG